MESSDTSSVVAKPRFTVSVPMAIIIAGALIAGSVLYIGGNNRGATALAPEATPTTIEDPSTLLSAADAFIGKADAPVTIVEFSDFQCPYCRSFFIGAYPELKKTFIDTGKVKLVFRHFPLSFHAGARPAALATQCADDQGKFWEMHDAIFAQQQKQEADAAVVARTVAFTAADVKTWAKGVGLNMTIFNQCLDSEKYGTKVDADLQAGLDVGVNGTPSFFVNGKLLIGAQPFSAFKAAIEQALE